MITIVQLKVQKFGKTLSRMVMPNIGAFIAWGFITALFISSGWLPNEKLATLVDPLLKYLLPLLIAVTGGRNVAGDRGGIIAAIATMGVIVGSDIPMFLGAMVTGPLAGLLIKKADRMMEGKIPAGFEMLVDNFSLGILGMICAIIGFFAIGPLVAVLTGFLSGSVSWIMQKGFLPLTSLFIEPGKVLFMNNAINHGILTPLGIEQVQKAGRSVMFLLEANPGSGLGVLTAYWLFAKGAMKNSAPGAIIIHFLGGIHEIYFPYILVKPALIIAPIIGSASAVAVFSLLGSGLVAPASPGSILAVMAMAPKGQQLIVLLGVLTAAVVSFLIAAPLVRRSEKTEMPDIEEAKKTALTTGLQKMAAGKIIFACDAGMGSSALGATRFRNRLQKKGLDIQVEKSSVDKIPPDAAIVICQEALSKRAELSAPEAELVIIRDFLTDKKLDELFERVAGQKKPPNPEFSASEVALHTPDDLEILVPSGVITGLESVSREEAILRAGELLEQLGYAAKGYSGSMLQREILTSTYIGMGIAIPHGTREAGDKILRSGIVVLQYPGGISFGEDTAYLVIGIAASGDDHMDILARISSSLDNEELMKDLISTEDKNVILTTLVTSTKKLS